MKRPCRYPYCAYENASGYLFCRVHWSCLPRSVRRAVKEAYADTRPHAAQDAIDGAVGWIFRWESPLRAEPMTWAEQRAEADLVAAGSGAG